MEHRSPYDGPVCQNTRQDTRDIRRLEQPVSAKAKITIFHPSAGSPTGNRSEEHTSELQSLMRISYAVFCLKKKSTTFHYVSAHASQKFCLTTQQTNDQHNTPMQ